MIVPIIIPFYQNRSQLERCLACIQVQTYTNTQVFVRDNTEDNILYTAAVNEGLSKYAYREDVDYILVLNQDAYLMPDALEKAVSLMKALPDVAIVCPIQVQEGDSDQVTWGGSLQAFPLGAHLQFSRKQCKNPKEVYWANGACMLIRTQAIREVGLLDKNLRFIASDADFSFSCRARGWKIVMCPQAVVLHDVSGSASSLSPELNLIKAQDAYYFGQKWVNGDLYRQLSAEGPSLDPDTVSNHMTKLKVDIETLKRAVQRFGFDKV